MLVSTNVAENDYPEWLAGSTYALGDRVIVSAQHKVYQSLTAGNTGNPPASSLDRWAEAGPTNRWKAFDSSNSTQTKRAGVISYHLKLGRVVNSIAALNLEGATSIRVRVIDPNQGLIYDRTVALAGQLVSPTWWDWFFGPRTDPRQLLLNDLMSAPGAEVLVDIMGNDALAVGVILLGQGRSFSLGVKSGARLGITDYSRKERNEFGDTVLVTRAFSKRASLSMLLRSSEVDTLNAFLSAVRATPCLWIGSDRYESLTVYGFYKSFDIVLSYRDFSDCELELEGLT